MITLVEGRPGKVVRVGPPYDIEPQPPAYIKNYNESRSISTIEQILSENGMRFGFQGHFQWLSTQFLGINTLHVLDSGCGNGIASKGIKSLAHTLGREIQVTGLTMARRNIRPAVLMGVDKLIVGRFQQYAAKTPLNPQYHFILDFFGPAYYDEGMDNKPEAITTLPPYAALLYPGGTALLTVDGLLSPNTARRESLIQLMDDSGLRVIQARNKYALVQKRAA